MDLPVVQDHALHTGNLFQLFFGHSHSSDTQPQPGHAVVGIRYILRSDCIENGLGNLLVIHAFNLCLDYAPGLRTTGIRTPEPLATGLPETTAGFVEAAPVSVPVVAAVPAGLFIAAGAITEAGCFAAAGG